MNCDRCSQVFGGRGLSALMAVLLASHTPAQVRVDMSEIFTVDAIYDNRVINQDSGGFFDIPNSFNFTVGGTPAGLPVDGMLNSVSGLGTYQLGNYARLNCLQVDSFSGYVSIDLPNAIYPQIGLLTSSSNGNAFMDAIVYYTDGTTDFYFQGVSAPDWFNHSTGTPEVITGMTRCTLVGNTRWRIENQTNPAIFEAILNPNPFKIVDRIEIGNGFFTNVTGNFRTRAGVFAMNALRSDSAVVQINLSSVFNTDVIWDAGNMYDDTAGFFDPPNFHNLVVGGSAINVDGLPKNGRIRSTHPGLGSYQLGDYLDKNAVPYNPVLDPVIVIPVTAGNYRRLGFLTACANGSSVFNVEIVYSDNTSDFGTVAAPDWFNHGSGTPEPITAMDRAGWNGTQWVAEERNSPALFEPTLAPNRSKTVVEVRIPGVASGSGMPHIFALNGQPASDLNEDGCSNDTDLLIVLFAFGSNDPIADINGDGIVNDTDLLIVLFNFGLGC